MQRSTDQIIAIFKERQPRQEEPHPLLGNSDEGEAGPSESALPVAETGPPESALPVAETGRPSESALPVAETGPPEEATKVIDESNESEAEGLLRENDIGLWPSTISNKMREHWVKNGASTVQHCDENLFSKHSVQQPRKDNGIPRKCTLSLFSRQNHNGEAISRNWLCFSPAKGRVYCFTCKLMCPHASRTKSLLAGEGICDWKHSQERIRSHEQSKEHIEATIAFSRMSKVTGRIDAELAREVERLENYWKSVLERVVSVIQFIAERGLAFRGDNELLGSPKNGNYLGILELIAQYDTFLADHLKAHGNRGTGHANYLSSTIMEELICIMGEQVLKEIVSRVKTSKYYSISLDSTPDASHVDQLTLVLRYMENDGPVERFVTFMANRGHSAQEMLDALMGFLQEYELELTNCRGQSYDNASAMSGKYNGLQAKVMEKNSLAAWIPCAAHSLNLVGKSAAECCLSAVQFFDFIEKLYVFFTSSTHRYYVLTEALKHADASLTIKRSSTTRWSCRAEATKALKYGYQQIKGALEEMASDTNEKGCVRCEAEGLAKRLNQLETGIYTVFWNDILQRVNATNQGLQCAKLDLNTAVASLSSLKTFITSKRDTFGVYESQGKELAGTSDYVLTKTRVRSRSIRLNPLDYGRTEEAHLSPSERYKTESFFTGH